MAVAAEAAHESDLKLARRWILLAASCLILAGLLASSLVVARTPAFSAWVGDPLLFKRALVVHVDLSIVVWFYAFVAGMFALVPSRAPRSPLSSAAPMVAAAGVVLLIAAALVPGAQPVLSNYVPVIDHPLYVAGLVTFAAAVLLTVFDGRLFPGNEVAEGAVQMPEATRVGLRTAGLAIFAATVTFFAAFLGSPRALPAQAYYEIVFWGGGHVLQIASEAAMVSVWCWLLAPLLGRSPLTRRQASFVFGALLLAAMLGPLLAMQDPVGGDYRLSFMRLMQWGIFPPVLLALGFIARALHRAHKDGTLRAAKGDGRLWAFFTSMALCLTGFVLGALIRGSNTVVPAHYHAAIGAVTASFMAVAYTLLPAFGMPVPSLRLQKLARVQPLIFGVGQFVFAVGFGFAGAHGMGRKAYGAEQVVRSLPETIGLYVMGLGGLVAVLGGLSFLWIMGASWLRSLRQVAPQLEREGSTAWTLKHRSTPSRG